MPHAEDTVIVPQATRYQFLKTVVAAAALAAPTAARASTRDFTDADADMKGLLSSFTTDLDNKEAAAAQKKIDEAKPLKEKAKAEFEKLTTESAKPRPKPGVAVPREKKKVERRMGDGGGMSGYSSLGY
jgi:hypothetical protein